MRTDPIRHARFRGNNWRFSIIFLSTLFALSAAGCGLDGEPDNGSAQSATAAAVTPGEARPLGPVCQVAANGRTLPAEVRETSGFAQGRRNPGVFWTHNDAGNLPELYALNPDGSLLARVRVTGAQLEDWEDLSAGPCASGNCLFIADTGDNSGDRELVTVYEVPEPDPATSASAPAVALHARFPDGRWDTESVFVMPDGALFLVTKGREGPIVLYRFPATRRPGETVTLERVRELFPGAAENEDRVTGATASPDGRWVGVRTNRSLYLYPAADLIRAGSAIAPTVVDLRPLGEPQGESLAIGEDGTIWLTSEAENRDTRPLLSTIRCTLPAP